jgi:hypothetical protein
LTLAVFKGTAATLSPQRATSGPDEAAKDQASGVSLPDASPLPFLQGNSSALPAPGRRAGCAWALARFRIIVDEA